MSKYTMTLEDYVLSRHFAELLDDAEGLDSDVSLWMQAVSEVTEDPAIAYRIISDEVLPDHSTVPFYTDDEDAYDEFVKSFTDTFYFDEIGQETMLRFRITLRAYFRNNMQYYGDLFASRVSSITGLAGDYTRTMDDNLSKLGTETDTLQHGQNVTYTPGATQKNRIIPLGGSAETELNETVAGGSEQTQNSGTDTTTRAFANRADNRHVVETITGAGGLDKAAIIAKYRELLLDINSTIFADMRQKHLFMEAW